MKKLLILPVFLLFVLGCMAQPVYLTQNNDLLWRYEKALNAPATSNIHTASKPYLYSDLQATINVDRADSSYLGLRPAPTNYLSRKLFYENFLAIQSGSLRCTLDPIFYEQASYDVASRQANFYNTRGFVLQGSIGTHFFFNTGYYENLLDPSARQRDFIYSHSVVPGYGYGRLTSKNNIDYGMAFGTITYKPFQWLSFQAGHDKNFIGDGYRSLLLSDASFNYPFLKATLTFGSFQYQYLLAQLQDLRAGHRYEEGFLTKNTTTHYLDWNVNKRFSIGLFQSVLWYIDTAAVTGWKDANYFNPLIYGPSLYHPGDIKTISGLNAKLKIFKSTVLYGQLAADDISLEALRKGAGWYGSKWAAQLGLKQYDLFGVENLHLQAELNRVSPYMYGTDKSIVPQLSYTHYNQPLGDPLGANFTEAILFLRYHHKAFYVVNEFLFAVQGADGQGMIYGGDPLNNYSAHPYEYADVTGQGVRRTLLYNDLRVGYLVNPVNNFVLEAGCTQRRDKSSLASYWENYFYLGLKVSMSNLYDDF